MKQHIILGSVLLLVLPVLAGATETTTAVSPKISTMMPAKTAPSSAIFSTTLQKGVSNADVSTLQTMLKTSPAIYPAGLVTGYYGAATEAAVKKLQEKYGLPQTGIVDSATQSVMYPNPYTTKVSITVIAPNGGESWTAGSVQQILWKSTVSPISTTVPPTPIPMPDRPTIMMSGTSAASATGTASGGTTTMVKPGSSIAMPPPFFNYASIDLVRDADPSYSYHIGSVNLYESQYSWKVPKNIAEASDYRVKVSIGNNVPCMYANDMQMMKTGTASAASSVRPICAAPMIASSFASDTSDSVFAVKGGSSINADVLRRQIAEIKAMLEKLSIQIADIESKLEGL